jgi:hypothetical protein
MEWERLAGCSLGIVSGEERRENGKEDLELGF